MGIYQRKMRTTTAICALFALLAVATAARRGVYTPPTAGKRYTSDSFDFLLFVQQWPGTLWNTAPKGVDGFTIHGLWPNNNDTGGPSFCTSATFDPSEVSSLLDELNVQWPSNQGDNEAYWAHEYEKHGTCAAVLPSPTPTSTRRGTRRTRWTRSRRRWVTPACRRCSTATRRPTRRRAPRSTRSSSVSPSTRSRRTSATKRCRSRPTRVVTAIPRPSPSRRSQPKANNPRRGGELRNWKKKKNERNNRRAL